MLFQGGLGFGALALGDLMARAEGRSGRARNPLAPVDPPRQMTAKSIIFLFMQGGPSHLETFDYKPALQKYDGKLLPKELQDFDLAQINTADSQVMAPQFEFQKFGESGQEISSAYPGLSQHADKLAIVKSLHHELFIHGSAMIMMRLLATRRRL